MKPDLKSLLKRFKIEGIKAGDLVVTFEIHRVISRFHGNKWSVATIHPKECTSCRGECRHERVMTAKAGQQGIAKLP